MTLFWKEALQTHLRFHEVIVLHGNIQDLFPIPDGGFRTIQEIIKESAAEVGWARTVSIDGALGDSGDNSGKSPGTPTSVPDGDTILSRLKPNPSTPTCWLVWNTQSLFWRVDRWERAAWQLQERLMRIIREARGQDRFILVFPDEGRVPGNFLAGVPSVVRMSVPIPDQSEREAWVNSDERIKPRLTDDKRSSDHRRLREFVAATDGLRWKELYAISRECNSESDPILLVREFKYGKDKDDWAALLDDPNRLSCAEDKFLHGSDPILGQDEAVRRGLAIVAKACQNLSQIVAPAYNRPRGIMFLVGPTGVGKTMLSKKLAELIFGSEDMCIVFDMTEYSQPQSDARLIGAAPGFVGYDEGGQLTSVVRNRPFSVLLFDEIDKADKSLLKIFMQILDEGRLTDGKGQSCYFSESLVIFTSNAGALDLAPGKTAVLSDGAQVTSNSPYDRLQVYYQEQLQLAPGFSEHPEILNRVGLSNIIPFRHISDLAHVRTVVTGLLTRTASHIYKHHKTTVKFENIDGIATLIASTAEWKLYGMRNVKQTFEVRVLEKIAWAMLKRPTALKIFLNSDASDLIVATVSS